MVQTASLHGTHVLGLEFGSAAQLSKRPGSVWNCLWGNALKRSPGIIRKSRVSYRGPGFLSSATWPSLPKKHYNGLNQTKSNSAAILWCLLLELNAIDCPIVLLHCHIMQTYSAISDFTIKGLIPLIHTLKIINVYLF